ADAQPTAHLRGGYILEHLQPEHFAQPRRQRLDLAHEGLAEALARHQREGVGGRPRSLPQRGEVAPGVVDLAVHAHVASLAPEAVLDLVTEDADEPGAQ